MGIDQNLTIEDWEAKNTQSIITDHQSSRLVSLSQHAPGVSAREFLLQARGSERFFWEDVRDRIIFAGFGTAVNLFAWGADRFKSIQSQAEQLFANAVLLNETSPFAAPRLFGGFAFQKDFVPDNTWSAFHPAHFSLPHYQLVQLGEDSWLTINALIPLEEDPQLSTPVLREALETRYIVLLRSVEKASRVKDEKSVHHYIAPAPYQLNYPMSFETWVANINEARRRIRTTSLKKVVLSRVAELRFPHKVNLEIALDYLNEHYNDSYRFLFEPRPHHAFYGATPELLAKVDGRTLTSMALAGSVRRSHDPKEDATLGQELLNSAKDRQEHDLVVISMLERLAPVTTQLEIAPQPGVYKLNNIQHLLTPIRGQLQQSSGILPIVELLHPTPALGGSPRSLAMQFISQTEKMPRGWYAGPIGWIDVNLDGAFAVGIRSAVAQGRRAWLYAGSGIVAESEPEKEWEETGLKFQPMLEAMVKNELAISN